MHIVTRTLAAAAIAVTGGLSFGLAAPAVANAATPAHAPAAHTAQVDRNARFALPAPVRLHGEGDGTAPFTAQATQRTICAGSTKCVELHGTGVPDQQVAVTYRVTKNPLFRDRGAAGITVVSEKVNVDGTGNWSLNTEFPNAVVTTGPAGGHQVEYHVVQSEDITSLVATARYAGAIPVR
jgi:hypothetical protein